jgi:hypothetical protein
LSPAAHRPCVYTSGTGLDRDAARTSSTAPDTRECLLSGTSAVGGGQAPALQAHVALSAPTESRLNAD